jgi:pimeloyl-ACP methyl ester carboxylesterase
MKILSQFRYHSEPLRIWYYKITFMKVIVDDLATEYRDEGNPNGQVVLLLHGWRNELHSFDALVHELAPQYRIVRLDLPGFGGTEVPRTTWELNDYVGFVGDFIKKLGLKVDVLIGHSLGGRIMIKGLGEDVFHPKKAVLIASAGIAKRKTVRNQIFKGIAKTGRAITSIPPLFSLREKLRNRLYAYAGSDYNNAGPLKDTFVKLISEDLSAAASRISVPTLLLWGDHDMETPLSDGERLSRLIPGAILKVFPGTGHHVHQERSVAIAETMKEFIGTP